jgi:PAS domain S-box-containing protein
MHQSHAGRKIMPPDAPTVTSTFADRTKDSLHDQQRYERMANTVPVMLYDSLLDPDGTSRFLYVAPKPCRELLELDPDQLLADMNLVWALIHPDDLERFQQEDAAANREGKVFNSEVRIITPGGRLKWLLVNSKPNPAEPGAPVVWSGYLQDITARKQAEEDRLELERKFEQAKKAESLGRMAAAIAHNFNNQLQAVIGNLELAIYKLPPEAEPVQHLNQALQAAGRSADITRLISGYLGQTPANHERLDLAEISRQTLSQLRDGMPKEVLLEAELPAFGPNVKANAHQLRQVLNNLVTNARESLDAGPNRIRLSVRTVAAAEIPSAHRFPPGWQAQDRLYACLEVTDSGCGIAKPDMEQLFDPFFTTKFTGRGLGLSLVLGVVKAHRGVITVRSEAGQGSVLQVYLPADEQAVPQPKVQPLLAQAFEKRGTVLLVEDEQPVREIAKVMLAELGFSVLEAGDGVEAMELFGRQREDIRLVLSDLTMPRMDGWELLTTLRQREPGLPVVLASGYDQVQIMERFHLDQPQAFLSKPYRLATLDETIHRALNDPVGCSDEQVS